MVSQREQSKKLVITVLLLRQANTKKARENKTTTRLPDNRICDESEQKNSHDEPQDTKKVV